MKKIIIGLGSLLIALLISANTFAQSNSIQTQNCDGAPALQYLDVIYQYEYDDGTCSDPDIAENVNCNYPVYFPRQLNKSGRLVIYPQEELEYWYLVGSRIYYFDDNSEMINIVLIWKKKIIKVPEVPSDFTDGL